MQHLNRRTFLKATGVLTAGAALLGREDTSLWADDIAKGAPHAQKLGWRLGCQAWTFHRSTFYEAMDKMAELGLHFIEAFPDQPLSAGKRDEKVGPKLSAEARREIKRRLSDKGLKLVNFGVGPANRQAFDFAKGMGIETLVSSPPSTPSMRSTNCARSIRLTSLSTTTPNLLATGARTSFSRRAMTTASESERAAIPATGCARTSFRWRLSKSSKGGSFPSTLRT
jgi:TAT (twin-arginine translocation) pathway signal sequence